MADKENIEQISTKIDDASLVLSIQLNKTVGTTVLNLESLIETMRATGASDSIIREVLLEDLQNGGRIFGQFRNQFKAMGEVGIGRMAQAGIYSIVGESEILKWQAVGKNICPDCEDRHGQEGTAEEFSLIGEPQSGFSICGMHCKCTLVRTGKWQSDPLKVPLPE